MEENVNIIRHEGLQDPFARVPKSALDNPRLSFKAKGVLAYLLGKPVGWKVRIKDLMNRSTDGRDAVRSGLNELRNEGYAKYEQIRCDGIFREGLWRISDIPLFLPQTGFPAPDKPLPENPLLSKNKVSKKEFSKNESKEPKEAQPFGIVSLDSEKTAKGNVMMSGNGSLEQRCAIPPAFKPDRRSKEQKLATLPIPNDFPSQEEFDQFVYSRCSVIQDKRQFLYDELCRTKWHIWKPDKEKWIRIADWREFVIALDSKIENANLQLS
jgi:hypothetical protein